MKDFKIALIAASLGALAAPLLAAPRLCANGRAPKLSGDAFAPVECSTKTLAVPLLPDVPVQPAKDAKTDLRDLDGRWEGSMVHALGRYSLTLTVKTTWSGKADLALDLKELQFHERIGDRLALVRGKGQGVYEAVLTSTLAPDASLKGGAMIGFAARPEPGTPGPTGAPAPPERQLDLLFANGAAHRVFFTLVGKDELRVRSFSAVPGAPLQRIETVLTRVKSQAP